MQLDLLKKWQWKNNPEKEWYINAAITRVQYSKKTLRLIKHILLILHENEEVFVNLKKKKLNHLHRIYYGGI